MAERVRLKIDGGVADVRLHRPEKLNAIDGAMFRALVEAGHALAENKSVRAVVLSGEGRGFSAGLDVANFGAMAQGSFDTGDSSLDDFVGTLSSSGANLAQLSAWIWQELPVPVIAAVHGVAFGAGLQIALGADIRIVAPDVRMSVMEIKWGLIPDVSGSQTLRRLVRLDVAKELTFTGRIVNGPEALALGLATRVTESPLQDALKLAQEIAGRSPDAVRSAKKLLNASGLASVEQGLALEWELQKALIASPNQIESVQANLEKRPAKFSDPA
jgi:enoyl-CoA hydratase/carnithine racemase